MLQGERRCDLAMIGAVSHFLELGLAFPSLSLKDADLCV